MQEAVSTTSPAVRIRVDHPDEDQTERRFTAAFRIGRDADCEVRLNSRFASRVHVTVTLERGEWWLVDQGSTNGTFLEGERVTRVPLRDNVRLTIGQGGPVVVVTVERPPPPKPRPRPDRRALAEHYLADDGEPAGERTIFIRETVATMRGKQRRHRKAAIATAAVAVVLLGVAAFQQWQIGRQESRLGRATTKIEKQEEAAADLFFEMKALDLQITQIRTVIEESANLNLKEQLARLEESRSRLADRYDAYVRELGTIRRAGPDELAMYRVARVFNESELVMPAGFLNLVRDMIQVYWQTPAGRSRFERAVNDANRLGYTGRIVAALRQHGLPAQFFYLALQESNLNVRAVGPLTRWGRAKGMWQFIPSTANRFGLDTGPFADDERVDLDDQRFDFVRATDAAAKYLASIYGTLAQASGLLVVASYNWGEHRIASKLETLSGPQSIPAEALAGIPENPRARTYWRFLSEYKDRMPEETKDYVLKIFSAAVIGEDPRRWGFDVDNPLAPYVATRP